MVEPDLGELGVGIMLTPAEGNDGTRTNLLFLDTCIISELLKTRHSWPQFAAWIESNNLSWAFTELIIRELGVSTRLHRNLFDLFQIVPPTLIDAPDEILAKEIAIHPSALEPASCVINWSNHNTIEAIKRLLSSSLPAIARELRSGAADKINRVVSERSPNFSRAGTGKYEKHQSSEFADRITLEALARKHRDFVKSFQDDDPMALSYPCFKSIRIGALATFIRYYIDQRQARKDSEVGDLSSLYIVPYCAMAILERDFCDTLRKVKNSDPVLASVVIEHIGYFRKVLAGPPTSQRSVWAKPT